MELKEFLSSVVGRYITDRLDNELDIHTVIASLDQAGTIQDILAEDLLINCTPEQIEQYVESDLLYECTPHGRYLEECIQYAIDNASLIESNHNADYANKIFGNYA